jgi:hypothetical protein
MNKLLIEMLQEIENVVRKWAANGETDIEFEEYDMSAFLLSSSNAKTSGK